MPWTPPTQDDFDENWVRPTEALDLGPDKYSMQTWLADRLRGGIIVAVARSTFDDTDHVAVTYIPVARAAWRDESAINAAFWSTGTLYFEQADATGYDRTRITYLDVRFDPETLKSTPPTESPSQSDYAATAVTKLPELEDQPPADKRPLSESLLLKWAALFKEAYPGGNQTLARLSVDGMFPDKHVTRASLRRVTEAQPVGKPKKISD